MVKNVKNAMEIRGDLPKALPWTVGGVRQIMRVRHTLEFSMMDVAAGDREKPKGVILPDSSFHLGWVCLTRFPVAGLPEASVGSSRSAGMLEMSGAAQVAMTIAPWSTSPGKARIIRV